LRTINCKELSVISGNKRKRKNTRNSPCDKIPITCPKCGKIRYYNSGKVPYLTTKLCRKCYLRSFR